MSSSWFSCLIGLLVCGWDPEANRDAQKLAQLCPEFRHELWPAVRNYVAGKTVKMEDMLNQDFGGSQMKWTILESQLTTEEDGSPVTKLLVMCTHGSLGMGRGSRKLLGILFGDLAWAHIEKAETDSVMSFQRVGQMGRVRLWSGGHLGRTAGQKGSEHPSRHSWRPVRCCVGLLQGGLRQAECSPYAQVHQIVWTEHLPYFSWKQGGKTLCNWTWQRREPTRSDGSSGTSQSEDTGGPLEDTKNYISVPLSQWSHSSRVSFIASGSWSPMSSLCSAGDRRLEKNAQEGIFWSFSACWDSTAPTPGKCQLQLWTVGRDQGGPRSAALNEALIEVCKPQETLELFMVFWSWPGLDRFHHPWIHFDVSGLTEWNSKITQWRNETRFNKELVLSEWLRKTHQATAFFKRSLRPF